MSPKALKEGREKDRCYINATLTHTHTHTHTQKPESE